MRTVRQAAAEMPTTTMNQQWPLRTLLMCLLLVNVCVLKNVLAVPTVDSMAIEATDELGRHRDDSGSDIAMPGDESEENIFRNRPPIKVVRDRNGTLSFNLDDKFGDSSQWDTNNQSPSTAAAGQKQPSDKDDSLLDAQAAGAGKTTTRRQQNTNDVELSRQARDALYNDSIVFPTDHRDHIVSPCANNKTFCEDVTDYPTDTIESIIKREESRFHGLFDSDTDIAMATELSNRFGEDTSSQAMCDSVIVTEYPTKWQVGDSWVAIVNTPTYRQGVRVERCKNPENACNFAKNFGAKVQTSCHQLTMDRKLVTVTLDANSKESTKYTQFSFPSCCQCRVTTIP